MLNPLAIVLRRAVPVRPCLPFPLIRPVTAQRSILGQQQRYLAAESDSSNEKQGGFRGPSSWRNFFLSMGVGFAAGFGVYWYIKRTKQQAMDAKQKRLAAGFGTPQIGGTWELVDFNNQLRSDKDYLGKWVLIYFGFTHCPDICPEELEKLCKIIDRIDNDPRLPKPVPLFFTVDPVRDTPERMKKYCEEYSPKLLGLGGTVEQVKAVCKKFRVYFGLGPKDPDGDYIVDHTVVIYVVNPEGKYVDHFIREPSADRIFNKISEHMLNYGKSKSWFFSRSPSSS